MSKSNSISKWLIVGVPIVLILFFTGLYFLLKDIDLTDDFNRPWWVWTLVAVGIILILLIIFRKKVAEKIKTPNVNWSWYKFWLSLAVILLALVLWFEVIPWIGSLWNPRQHFESSNSSSGSTTNRAFFLGKENAMKAGVWYTFTQDDGPLIQFKPTTPNTTIVYRIIKLEDETREWKVEVWTDERGEASENRLNPHGIEPNKAAKGGDSMIMVDRDATVVSYY